MPKKSLQGWYNSNDITYSQKEIIKKFGVGDYYPECERKDFKKIYCWNSILMRNTYKLEDGFGERPIHQMSFFSSWWNNNLIIVICGGNGSTYDVKLIVYEMPHRQMREIMEIFNLNVLTWDLGHAKRRAKEIEGNLKWENNPILYIWPTEMKVSYRDDYNSVLFPVVYGFDIGSEQVKRIKVDFNSARYNPDSYFKPLDIAMIYGGGKMVHTCVYLGKGKICHALSGNQVRIEDWSGFFSHFPSANKMLRYHPVIAFKKTEEIIKHIANCYEKQETYYSSKKKRDFDIYDNNCENFTNRCVLGLNFSQLAEKKNEERYGTPKTGELDVAEQLNKTKRDLDALTKNNTPLNKINEIKEYRRSSGYENFEIMRDGIKMDACIEVQPKTSIFKDMVREYLDRQ